MAFARRPGLTNCELHLHGGFHGLFRASAPRSPRSGAESVRDLACKPLASRSALWAHSWARSVILGAGRSGMACVGATGRELLSHGSGLVHTRTMIGLSTESATRQGRTRRSSGMEYHPLTSNVRRSGCARQLGDTRSCLRMTMNGPFRQRREGFSGLFFCGANTGRARRPPSRH
jgi:hypothetical protein